MRPWVNVAVLARTYNLEGGFVARPAADLPFLLEEGMEVALVPPQLDAPRRVTVRSVAPKGDGSAVVFFDEVTDAAVAARLAGCSCLVRREEVAEAIPVSAEECPWIGWQMMDARAGLVGTVFAVRQGPGQSWLVVQDSAGHEVLVPLVDEFVKDVDEQARRLSVALPAGLLEL